MVGDHMTEETKNLLDIILNTVALVGAAVAFCIGLHQWRRAQTWQRAEKFDKFVEKFDSDELLRLAAIVVDWTERRVTFEGRPLTVTNKESLLALRDHRTIKLPSVEEECLSNEQNLSKKDPMFPGEQSTLRDAYDALLGFFERLELAISSQLIDATPAKACFSYWLEHFLLFDKHPDRDGVLNGITPQAIVVGYIVAYGDSQSISRLCKHFSITPPAGLTGEKERK